MSAGDATSALLAGFGPAVEAVLRDGTPRDPSVAAEIVRVLALLRDLPPASGGLGEEPHAITAWLSPALDAWTWGGWPLRAELVSLAGRLPWRFSYAPRADAPGLDGRVAFAELIGPAAPIRSDRLCAGVTLIAPGTLYPDHRHPAIELYRVLSGMATWSAAGSARPVPPGGWVLHPSGVVHAMRTGAEPLLALYTWTGEDVTTSSVWAWRAEGSSTTASPSGSS